MVIPFVVPEILEGGGGTIPPPDAIKLSEKADATNREGESIKGLNTDCRFFGVLTKRFFH